jgi:hypothetical protein
MEWLGILLISPAWGYLSTRCFIQASLGVAQFFIHIVGFFKGAVPGNDNALYMGVAIFNVVLFSLLLLGGFWLLTVILPFGQTQTEVVVYWVSAGISFLFFLKQVPSKIRGSWRYATIPNALWVDSMKEKIKL